MEFETWAPIYDKVVAAFDFDVAADREARDQLAAMVEPFDLDRLDFSGQRVAIAGGSDVLRTELADVRSADRKIAVSSAARVLIENGIEPDMIVTDLDGTPETARELSVRGVPVAVHAHGDNIEALRSLVPTFELENVLGTTQVEPTETVLNFGGFTDGDRAAFFADHFGAATLTFPGWNLDDQQVTPLKARKIEWAGRLLRCLERRRSERFALLDSRRQTIDATTSVPEWPCTES